MFDTDDFLTGTISTSDIVDTIGEHVRVCDVQFQQYGLHRRWTGTIRTVRCLNDSALIKKVLAEPGDGAILVVDGGGSLHSALLGDVTAGIGAKSGWSGVLINGAVRDVDALASVPIGVKSLGANPRRSGKAGAGQIDVPVSFGGVVFQPGDTIYSDTDGVVALTP
ncbi:ribonuclease E activity regulator RraA [Streptomyces sp. NPDC059134]|uniref:ribonuclease E activity regulator RraA n=1 Tax=Streptomyces sp. NPDC059134 TaxID=3346738 RepID=UPI003680E087